MKARDKRLGCFLVDIFDGRLTLFYPFRFDVIEDHATIFGGNRPGLSDNFMLGIFDNKKSGFGIFLTIPGTRFGIAARVLAAIGVFAKKQSTGIVSSNEAA